MRRKRCKEATQYHAFDTAAWFFITSGAWTTLNTWQTPLFDGGVIPNTDCRRVSSTMSKNHRWLGPTTIHWSTTLVTELLYGLCYSSITEDNVFFILYIVHTPGFLFYSSFLLNENNWINVKANFSRRARCIKRILLLIYCLFEQSRHYAL